MPTAPRQRRFYDPSVRKLVIAGRGQDLVRQLNIPRSTVSGWKSRPLPTLVSVGPLDQADVEDVEAQVIKLERRVKVLTAVMVLLLTLVRISGARLHRVRVPDGSDKKRLIWAVDRTAGILPKATALRIVGLSSTRYGQWRRRGGGTCRLDDQSSCPRSHPGRLLPADVQQMHDMATSPDYRHVPTGTLAMLAQRLGKVFASASTWCKYVRERGWRCPRRRVHPSSPRKGIRATAPNGLWHIDASVLRLLDGSKVYLRAVIDNFSRRILAWSVSASLDPLATAPLLVAAMAERARSVEPGADPQSLMVDGGVENFNDAVTTLVDDGLLARILAQTDVQESNSLIERFWLSAKHSWLYLNDLGSLATVQRLVEFYVTQHNSVLPHSAHHGRTPDEVYFGTGADVPDELAAARAKARKARLEANRKRACEECRVELGLVG